MPTSRLTLCGVIAVSGHEAYSLFLLTSMAQRPTPQRLATAPHPRLATSRKLSLSTIPEISHHHVRRNSITSPQQVQGQLGPKSANPQRTSKTSQKLVLLPEEPQKTALPEKRNEQDEERVGEGEVGMDGRSAGERMTKEQRHRAGYDRLTAYCIADRIKPRLTTAFLKREHGVTPRVFDEAIYVVCLTSLFGVYSLPRNSTLNFIDVPPPSLTGLYTQCQRSVVFWSSVSNT